MAGVLDKLSASLRISRPSTATRAHKAKAAHSVNRPDKTELRDVNDPRILYRASTRARRLSMRVNSADREVIVICPNKNGELTDTGLNRARKFVAEQRDWIEVQLEGLPPPQPFEPGGMILLRGQLYRLVHKGTRGHPAIHHDQREIHVPAPEGSFSGRVRRLLIREARNRLEIASHHYAEKLGKTVGRVSIRDTRSRWGSCITRKGVGHISYSWRLISAPDFVLEYVAAHECAHLVHADHSSRFWSVCKELYPDLERAKTWLRKNGALLHAVGSDF